MVFRHHSAEVKLLALRALENGFSIEAVESMFQVSRRSLGRWQDQLETTFMVARRNSGMVSWPRAIPPALLHVLVDLIEEAPSLYLDEIADYLSVVHGELPSISTISRTLLDLGLDRKIMRKMAAQRESRSRAPHRCARRRPERAGSGRPSSLA